MPGVSRRGLLRAVGATLPVALAGCNAGRDDTATTATADGTTNADAAVSTSLTRYEYLVASRRVPSGALPVSDAVPVSELPAPAGDAVRTAVDEPRFETDDPGDRLLRAVEDLDLVAVDDTYYVVSHTFTEYTVDLVEDPDPGSDASVATWESLDDGSAVREALALPLPQGPELPTRPYRTLVLRSELERFLDEYTHLADGDRTFRIDRRIERHFPPYTLTVERAGETDRYGERLVDVEEFGAASREFLERVRRPTDVPTAGWGDGSLYANRVPRPVERAFEDGSYVRPGDLPPDAVLSVSVRDVDWDRPPLELSAGAADSPAGVELAVSNATDSPVRLTNRGVAPFGVLWAVPEGGSPVQLWTPRYESAPNVDAAGDVAEPTDHVDRELGPGRTLAETYRLARSDESVTPGAYELRGRLAGEWQRSHSPAGPDDQFVVYPFGVTLTAENS
jgi:hypothetical protein